MTFSLWPILVPQFGGESLKESSSPWSLSSIARKNEAVHLIYSNRHLSAEDMNLVAFRDLELCVKTAQIRSNLPVEAGLEPSLTYVSQLCLSVSCVGVYSTTSELQQTQMWGGGMQNAGKRLHCQECVTGSSVRRSLLHTESFSGAALRGDSGSSAEANPSLFIHYTCRMYNGCLPVRHRRGTRVPQNWAHLSARAECRPRPRRGGLIENVPTRSRRRPRNLAAVATD